MKVRLTIMTENNKHVDNDINVETLESIIRKTWDVVLNHMICKDFNDKAIIEKVEVVEK